MKFSDGILVGAVLMFLLHLASHWVSIETKHSYITHEDEQIEP